MRLPKTAPVEFLVVDALRTISRPYGQDVIEDVFLAIIDCGFPSPAVRGRGVGGRRPHGVRY